MTDEMRAAGSTGGGGNVPPRRRKTDQDSIGTADAALAEFRASLIREISKRDRETGNLLGEKMDAQHAVIVHRLDGIQSTQDAHATWIRERDRLQADEDRQRAEQQLRASILADLEEAGKARKRMHAERWGKTISLVIGALVAALGGVLLYSLESLDHLQWDRHGQVLALSVFIIATVIVLLVRYGP